MKIQKILIILLLALITGAIGSYIVFPKNQWGEKMCYLVYAPIKAHHPVLFFIEDTFDNECLIPRGWRV